MTCIRKKVAGCSCCIHLWGPCTHHPADWILGVALTNHVAVPVTIASLIPFA